MVSYVSLEQVEHYSGITLAGQIIITACPASAVSLTLLYGYIVRDAALWTFCRGERRGHRGAFCLHSRWASHVSPLSSPLLTHTSQFDHGQQSMPFLLREISPAAKDGTARPTVKSNECRCIYEMQASVYSNNSSRWGLSLWSTLRIDHLLNTSHPSCSLPF